jgi:hypothetical protein
VADSADKQPGSHGRKHVLVAKKGRLSVDLLETFGCKKIREMTPFF